MASIKIHDLRPAGSELFNDSESFLNELTEGELGVSGGARATLSISISISLSLTYSFSWTRTRTF
jgi:hypothetical protein